MRIIAIVFIVISSLSINSYSQSKCDCFDRLRNLSRYYDNINDYKMSISVLKDAVSFLDADNIGDFYFEIAEAFKSNKEIDSSATYYTKAIQFGYPASWIMERSPEIYKKMDSKKIKRYTQQLKEKIDFDLYDKFVQTLAIDQSFRNDILYPLSETSDKTLSAYKKEIFDTLFSKIDDNTFEFVKWVLDNYQFPSSYKLGFYPKGFMRLIMHTTDKNNEQGKYLFSKLEGLNKQCNFPEKSKILFLKDRQYLYNNKKSLCGLMGHGSQFEIEHIDDADSIRFSYNQIRLKEFFANDSLPKEYKPIPYPDNYFCLKKYHIE